LSKTRSATTDYIFVAWKATVDVCNRI